MQPSSFSVYTASLKLQLALCSMFSFNNILARVVDWSIFVMRADWVLCNLNNFCENRGEMMMPPDVVWVLNYLIF